MLLHTFPKGLFSAENIKAGPLVLCIIIMIMIKQFY